jgi:hypothetical protein
MIIIVFLGSSPFTFDVVSKLNVGIIDHAVLTNINLENGKIYYAMVEGIYIIPTFFE